MFLVIGLVYLGSEWVREGRVSIGDYVLWPRDSAGAADSPVTAAEKQRPGEIERLFAEGRSDVVVRASGGVARVLADDNKGSRHQRFIFELESGHTVLVAHNIDLAPRVPLGRGDSVEVKGEYEWTEQGGVLHWTHHDPQRRHEGGWIKHSGETYE